MSQKFHFSSAEDEKLIEIVAMHPALYNAMHEDYKDQIIKENIWKEVSQTVERTVADCKKRWRNIRETYMKQRKAEPTGSAAKQKKWSLLAYLDFLNNVPYERSTKSNVNLVELEMKVDEDVSTLEETVNLCESSSASEIICTPTTSSKKLEEISSENERKRKRLFSTHENKKKINDNSEKFLNILQKRSTEREQLLRSVFERKPVEQEDDSTLSFFKSIAMTVKTFNPELIIEAKSRILSVVSELEIRSLRQSKQKILQQSEEEQYFPTNLLNSRPGTSNSETPSDIATYYTNYSSDLSLSSENDFNAL